MGCGTLCRRFQRMHISLKRKSLSSAAGRCYAGADHSIFLGNRMEVHRVNLTKARLAAMPIAERIALLLLGHAANEINVLSKLILMSRKQPPTIQLVDHVETAQTFVVMRLLIGKLHEAWEMFKARLQADAQIRSKYLSALTGEAGTALTELNKHFGQGSVLTKIRNKISFHYKDEGNLTEANFQRLPESEAWEFYLCRSVANSFYFASELVAQAGVLDLVKPSDDPAAATDPSMDAQSFAALCDIVILVSGQITVLFGELIASLVATSIGDDLEVAVVDVANCPKISTFELPYFFDEDDALPPVGNTHSV